MSISDSQQPSDSERMTTDDGRCRVLPGGWAPVGHQAAKIASVRPARNPTPAGGLIRASQARLMPDSALVIRPVSL